MQRARPRPAHGHPESAQKSEQLPAPIRDAHGQTDGACWSGCPTGWAAEQIEHRSIDVAIRFVPGNERKASRQGCDPSRLIAFKPDLARRSPILQKNSGDTGLGVFETKKLY